MFHQVKVPILGIVENMSYLMCPHCSERIDVFSYGGGRRTAERDEGELPGRAAARIRKCGSAATPATRSRCAATTIRWRRVSSRSRATWWRASRKWAIRAARRSISPIETRASVHGGPVHRPGAAVAIPDRPLQLSRRLDRALRHRRASGACRRGSRTSRSTQFAGIAGLRRTVLSLHRARSVDAARVGRRSSIIRGCAGGASWCRRWRGCARWGSPISSIPPTSAVLLGFVFLGAYWLSRYL